MTLEEITAARATAGARYAAAVAELHASLVDLAALDRTLDNSNINPGGHRPIRTFGHLPKNLGGLEHQEFAPAPLGGNWHDEVRQAAESDVLRFRG